MFAPPTLATVGFLGLRISNDWAVYLLVVLHGILGHESSHICGASHVRSVYFPVQLNVRAFISGTHIGSSGIRS
ncbi:hypothetical protein GCM10020255_061070 [Rhodococcus baikonurensis]